MIAIIGRNTGPKAAISLGRSLITTRFYEYGAAMTAAQFDLIRVISAPRTKREEKWLREIVSLRLKLMGKMLHDY